MIKKLRTAAFAALSSAMLLLPTASLAQTPWEGWSSYWWVNGIRHVRIDVNNYHWNWTLYCRIDSTNGVAYSNSYVYIPPNGSGYAYIPSSAYDQWACWYP